MKRWEIVIIIFIVAGIWAAGYVLSRVMGMA
jgi:hypothetical protein